MKKILVITGATGKKSGGYFAYILGKNIETVNSLFPDGIRAIVRKTSDTNELYNSIPQVEKYIGDLTEKEVLKKAFTNADTVVHIAGIHWSREVVEVAANCHVRRLILVHTTGIYSKYKEAGEEYRQIDEYVYCTCKKNNIVLTILRPTMIYGNVNDHNVVVFIKMVDKLPLMPVVDGAKYELQPVHYKDLGNAYYKVLINEAATANKDFNLSGGAPIQLKDMLNEIGKNLGKNVKFISCPLMIAYAGAWLLYVVTFGKKDFREKVQRLCEPRVYSHELATMTFGYNPRTFEVGIVEEVEEYLRNKG
jgi:nucleoside-diphosphate-sugar epimerase